MIINSPQNWQVHYRYPGGGLGQLFSSGADLSGWGFAEWGVIGLGAYILYSVFSTTKRGVGAVTGYRARRISRRRRRRQLREELASL